MEKERVNLNDKQRIAFVGSGGAVKALWYHFGVMKALEEAGFGIVGSGKPYEIKEVVGCSAGSIFGAFTANNFTEDRVLWFLERKSFWRYFINPHRREKGKMYGLSYADIFPPNLPTLDELYQTAKDSLDINRYRNLANDAQEFIALLVPEWLRTGDIKAGLEKVLNEKDDVYYFGIENWLRAAVKTTALSNTDRLERYLEDILPVNDFKQLQRERGMDLYIIASELDQPRKAIFGPKHSPFTTDPWADRWIDSVPIATACAASSSLPIAYRPKKLVIEGEKIYFIDGEVKKTLSSHVAVDNGADLVIVSHTLEPYHYTQQRGSLVRHGFLSVLEQAVFIGVAQKIRSAWQLTQMRTDLYAYVGSEEFRRDLTRNVLKGVDLADREKLEKNIVEFLRQKMIERLKTHPDLQYLNFPPPNELFFMDHFNIFPHYVKKLINVGYKQTKQILAEQYELVT